jgi:hypothetical protein
MKMTANPLGPEHPQGSQAGGQTALMDQLPTDSGAIPETTKRFIRGHLLNYDLGGPGKDFNLFPITAQANVRHFNEVEKTVKEWVNNKKLWVSYEAKVTASNVLIPLKRDHPTSGAKYKAVDSVLDLKASILSLSASKLKPLAVRIESKIDESEYLTAGAGSDLKPAPFKGTKPDAVQLEQLLKTTEADARDDPIQPLLVPKSGTAAKPVFEQAAFDALADARRRWKAGVWTKIGEVPGIGPSRVQALEAAYNAAVGQKPGDRDLSSLSPESLTQFRIVTGPSLWPLVLAAIA